MLEGGDLSKLVEDPKIGVRTVGTNSRRRNIYEVTEGIRCFPELFNTLTPRLGFRSR